MRDSGMRRKKGAASLRRLRIIPLRLSEKAYPAGQRQQNLAGPAPGKAMRKQRKKEEFHGV